jgi:hypothetical protein
MLTTKHINLVILLLGFVFLLSGCGGATSGSTSFTQTAGDLTAMLAVEPFPPVPMETTTLKLTLQDQSNQPISGATVGFDLTMPAMEMPPNHPQAVEQGQGVYLAETTFTMAGEWQIRVDVSYANTSEQFTFNLKTR